MVLLLLVSCAVKNEKGFEKSNFTINKIDGVLVLSDIDYIGKNVGGNFVLTPSDSVIGDFFIPFEYSGDEDSCLTEFWKELFSQKREGLFASLIGDCNSHKRTGIYNEAKVLKIISDSSSGYFSDEIRMIPVSLDFIHSKGRSNWFKTLNLYRENATMINFKVREEFMEIYNVKINNEYLECFYRLRNTNSNSEK